MMDAAAQLKRSISRQLSMGSGARSGRFSFRHQVSIVDPQRQMSMRFSFGRQSSLDPTCRSPVPDDLSIPDNLDSAIQLLFMASRGDTRGVEDLLNEGADVNNIDLDGRTALHIAACEGHVEVAKLLISRKVNMNARDRWGSTAIVDAKHYGNMEVYNILKACGAKVPVGYYNYKYMFFLELRDGSEEVKVEVVQKTKTTPMTVANPKEVPEYELNPLEVQVRRRDGIAKGTYQVAKWNGTKVVVKILDKESHSHPDCINAFQHELMVLEKVRHPNLVQFVGAVTQNIPMMILVEYHPKGDLHSYLERKKHMAPSKALRFALDIARGMNYLHGCKPDPILHCNLMPKNIFLDSGGRLKIAGFGLRQLSIISPQKYKLQKRGDSLPLSSLYMPPEVQNDEIFDKSADVYSFAIILYEMIEGLHHFSQNEGSKSMCLEGKRPPLKKLKHYPTELKTLIEMCWSEDPSIRPNFAQVIVELDSVFASCTKQGWWKDAFKLHWL